MHVLPLTHESGNHTMHTASHGEQAHQSFSVLDQQNPPKQKMVVPVWSVPRWPLYLMNWSALSSLCPGKGAWCVWVLKSLGLWIDPQGFWAEVEQERPRGAS